MFGRILGGFILEPPPPGPYEGPFLNYYAPCKGANHQGNISPNDHPTFDERQRSNASVGFQPNWKILVKWESSPSGGENF